VSSIGIDAVVVLVGGIARAEASAVRAAVQLMGKKVFIATTDVCGADQFDTMT
jgi:nicotinic acid phosphoribosyltransferase